MRGPVLEPPSIHLQLSGAPQAERAGHGAWPLAARDAALLAWLAIEGPTSRDRMAALLWPDSSAARARTAMRQRLFQLKKQLGRDLAVGTPLLQLAEGVSHDLEAAVDVLGDLTLPDAPELMAWLNGQRSRRLTREREALQDQAQALEEVGDLARALSAAQALLRLDAQSEAAHRRVMRLHYLLGDRAAALLSFDQCERMLKHEVGARPSSETMALLQTIEQSGPAAPAAAPRAIPASVLRPPRMVGRDRELAALARARDAAQVAAVIGEAGIGKSRLLSEFAATWPGAVLAAARPGDRGVPFATLARLLRAVAERCRPPALHDDARQQLARVLPELATPGAGPAEGPPVRLQRAIERLLEAAIGLQGLILDDLHFADDASLDMLQALTTAAERPALSWTLAFRPAEADTTLRSMQVALDEAARLVAVPLLPLDEALLAELVDQLGLGLDGRAMAPALRQRTGGNPLYALETLKQAWAEQALGRLQDGADLPRPPSVERLIDRRIARLSPAALALARTASIAGVDFCIPLAEAVLGAGAMQMADALNELESAQVLRDTQFAHDLIYDAVLRSVPRAIARHTHGQVAQWLEGHAGEPARIALHWLQAGQPGPAVRWLKAAADGAALALRAKEHCEFLLQAADIEESLGAREQAFQTLRPIIDRALYNFMPDPMVLADRLERLASTPRQRVQARIDRGGLLSHAWRMPEAMAVAREAVEMAGALDDAQMLVEARHELAINASMAGESRVALAMFVQVEATLEALPQLVPPEGFLSNHAIALERVGRLRDAVKYFQRFAEQARQLGAWSNYARTLANLAITRNLMGHTRQALEDATEALRVYAMYDEPASATCGVRITLARLNQILGRWDDALRWIDAVEATPGKPAFYAPSIAVRRAECWIDLGQFARAISALETLAEESAIPRVAFGAHCELARARRWLGQPWQQEIERARALLPADLQADQQNRLRLQLEACRSEPPQRCAAATDSAIALASALGMDGVVLAAWDMRAHCLREHDAALAAAAAAVAVELADHSDQGGLYKPELWLNAALAMRAAGQTARADGIVERAVGWLHERIAEGQVPRQFADSFLHRNPVNRALLTWKATVPGTAA